MSAREIIMSDFPIIGLINFVEMEKPFLSDGTMNIAGLKFFAKSISCKEKANLLYFSIEIINILSSCLGLMHVVSSFFSNILMSCTVL